MYWTVCAKQIFAPRVDPQYPPMINELGILDTLDLSTLMASRIMLPPDQVVRGEIIMKGTTLILQAKSEEITARGNQRVDATIKRVQVTQTARHPWMIIISQVDRDLLRVETIQRTMSREGRDTKAAHPILVVITTERVSDAATIEKEGTPLLTHPTPRIPRVMDDLKGRLKTLKEKRNVMTKGQDARKHAPLERVEQRGTNPSCLETTRTMLAKKGTKRK
jgi:hypothetical protein